MAIITTPKKFSRPLFPPSSSIIITNDEADSVHSRPMRSLRSPQTERMANDAKANYSIVVFKSCFSVLLHICYLLIISNKMRKFYNLKNPIYYSDTNHSFIVLHKTKAGTLSHLPFAEFITLRCDNSDTPKAPRCPIFDKSIKSL